MSSTQSVNLFILKRAAERLAKRIGRTGLSSGADKRPLISMDKPLEPFSVVMFTRCTVSKHHYSFPSGRTSYLALFPEEQIIELFACFSNICSPPFSQLPHLSHFLPKTSAPWAFQISLDFYKTGRPTKVLMKQTLKPRFEEDTWSSKLEQLENSVINASSIAVSAIQREITVVLVFQLPLHVSRLLQEHERLSEMSSLERERCVQLGCEMDKCGHLGSFPSVRCFYRSPHHSFPLSPALASYSSSCALLSLLKAGIPKCKKLPQSGPIKQSWRSLTSFPPIRIQNTQHKKRKFIAIYLRVTV